MSSNVFDNTGSIYNLSRVINADGSFNLEAYQAYSPLFLPPSGTIAYGLAFASITALLMHTLLYNSKRIWANAQRNLREQPDIHARLMSVYKEVPHWWYFSVFCACINNQLKPQTWLCIMSFTVTTLAFGVVVIEVWDTQLPIWAFVLSIIIGESVQHS